MPVNARGNYSSAAEVRVYNLVDISEIAMRDESVELSVGDTYTVCADVYPTNYNDAALIWTSSDPEVASVDENGVGTALTEGTTTVTAQVSGTELQASCEVTVGTSVPENHTLTVLYTKDASLTVNGEPQRIADLLGKYEADVLGGEELQLAFTPATDGRTFAEVLVNGGKVDFEADSFTYDLTMPNADTTVEIQFTTVYKETLGQIIEYAKSVEDQVEEAVPAVQEAFAKALENAEAVYAEKTSTQDVINQAWSDLLDVLHLLEFKPGDTPSLESLVEQLKGIGSDPYTEDSYQALQDALAEAEAVLADENAMDDSIKEAYDALLEAAENLQFVADLSQLEMLMAKADEIFENAAFYTDDGWDALEEAYEAALAVTEDSEQSAVDEAAQGLVKAIAAMRLKADKSQSQAEVDRANQIDLSLYTKASVRALEKALDEAYAILENEDLSEDDQAVVDAGTKAVCRSDRRPC